VPIIVATLKNPRSHMKRWFAAAAMCAALLVAPLAAYGQYEGYQFGYQYGLGLHYANQVLGGNAFYGPNAFPLGDPAVGGFVHGPFPSWRALSSDRGFRHFGTRHSVPFHLRVEAPPYFALYPPVYYDSQIIRRPYGISPYAAPPGIPPTEMMMGAPQPERVVNPYVEPHNDHPPQDGAGGASLPADPSSSSST
jgi:hypothetical protein